MVIIQYYDETAIQFPFIHSFVYYSRWLDFHNFTKLIPSNIFVAEHIFSQHVLLPKFAILNLNKKSRKVWRGHIILSKISTFRQYILLPFCNDTVLIIFTQYQLSKQVVVTPNYYRNGSQKFALTSNQRCHVLFLRNVNTSTNENTPFNDLAKLIPCINIPNIVFASNFKPL